MRDEVQVRSAIKAAVDKFGGIDILINNASAISLTPTESTDMKRYDLMQNINTRGTFLVSKECIPYLKKSSHPHILNMSPPLNMKPHWFGPHVAYTIAKYGMSMCVLGMAEELKQYGIGVNALWPRTAIQTAAMDMLAGSDSSNISRKPEIMADAAYSILTRDPKTTTGYFFIDDEVITAAGIKDLKQYACDPNNVDNLLPDFFLDVVPAKGKVAEATGKGNTLGIPLLFNKIESFLSREIVQKINATYEFNIKDSEEVWYLDLKTGSGKCGKGKLGAPADAVLTMKSDHFLDMFAGKIKASNAFMQGKLKISGDMTKAMKLEKLMTGLKSKL